MLRNCSSKRWTSCCLGRHQVRALDLLSLCSTSVLVLIFVVFGRKKKPMEGPAAGCFHPDGAGRLLVCLRAEQEVQRRPWEAHERPGGAAEGRAEPAGVAGEVSLSLSE